MSNTLDIEELDSPLHFHEDLAEHVLTDDIRKAFVWASVQRFLVNDADLEDIEEDEFSPKEKSLALAVVFHGPFTDFEKAVTQAQGLGAIVVIPVLEWSDTNRPIWIASLSN